MGDLLRSAWPVLGLTAAAGASAWELVHESTMTSRVERRDYKGSELDEIKGVSPRRGLTQCGDGAVERRGVQPSLGLP